MVPWALVVCSAIPVQGPEDATTIAKLLAMAFESRREIALPLVRQAAELLDARRLPPPEREQLSHQLVKVLRQTVQSPNDVRAVFAPEQLRVSRQVYFGRYREMWVCDLPRRLALVFDCVKGKEPRLLSIELLP